MTMGRSTACRYIVRKQPERIMPAEGTDHSEMAAIQGSDNVGVELTGECDVDGIREADGGIVAEHRVSDEQEWANVRNLPTSGRDQISDEPQDRPRRSRSLPFGDQVVEFGEDARRDNDMTNRREAIPDGLMVRVGVVEEREQGGRICDYDRKGLRHPRRIPRGTHRPARTSRGVR